MTEESSVERVRGICGALLNAATVPADQPLLDLGVNSLLVIRLRRQLIVEFGVKLPLSVFFDGSPTVSDVAHSLDRELLVPSAPENSIL
jgi:Phosphopantetheine attachment site